MGRTCKPKADGAMSVVLFAFTANCNAFYALRKLAHLNQRNG